MKAVCCLIMTAISLLNLSERLSAKTRSEFQHLHEPIYYETLKRVQGDKYPYSTVVYKYNIL